MAELPRNSLLEVKVRGFAVLTSSQLLPVAIRCGSLAERVLSDYAPGVQVEMSLVASEGECLLAMVGIWLEAGIDGAAPVLSTHLLLQR